MSPEITLRKLGFLINYVELLRKYKNADLSIVNQHHLEIERLLHLIVEAMGDINYHLLVQKKAAPPKSLRDSFLDIAKNKIIDELLAQNLAPSAGLRNALVHMYDALDIEFIQKSIQSALQFVPAYIKQIELHSSKKR